MRIKDIKTREQFYYFADVWYQRTRRLREVWQNENHSEEYRARAYLLFYVMMGRVLKLTHVAKYISMPEFPKDRPNRTSINNI